MAKAIFNKNKDNGIPGEKMNPKLLLGLALVLLSLVAGKITTAAFILHVGDRVWRYSSIAVYVMTWLVLILGIYICGVEGSQYVEKVSRYFSYRHYHHHAKRLYHKGRNFRFLKKGGIAWL